MYRWFTKSMTAPIRLKADVPSFSLQVPPVLELSNLHISLHVRTAISVAVNMCSVIIQASWLIITRLVF